MILFGVWAALVVGGLFVWPIIRNQQARLAAGLLGLAVIILLFPSQAKFERFLERAKSSSTSPC